MSGKQNGSYTLKVRSWLALGPPKGFEEVPFTFASSAKELLLQRLQQVTGAPLPTP